MRIEVHDRVAVVGKTGSGKGNKVKALLTDELGRGARVVAFDPHDEYSRHGRATPHVRLGPLARRVEVSAVLKNVAMLDEPELSLALVPDRSSRRHVAEDFKAVADVVGSTGNMLFVVEEVGLFGDLAVDELDDAACQLRHEGVAVILVCQRAMQIPKTARTQLSQLYSGMQNDPDDLTVLRKIAGADFAERVPSLPRGELLHWDAESKTRRPK